MASSKVQALEYSHETTFCENVTTTASRIPFLGARLTRNQPRIANMGLQVRQNAQEAPYLGPREATLEIDVHWCGRGSLANSATTDWWLLDLLQAGLGGGTSAVVGDTAVTAGSDTDTVTMATIALDDGVMWRTGVRGDGRAEGRWGVAAGSSAGTTVNSLVGHGVAPITGDVIYKVDLAYPTESGQGSERFLLHYNESGAGTMVHGCVLTGIKFSAWTTGAIPTITLVYTCAYWQDYTATFPVNATIQESVAAPVQGGYFFYNTVGTTTAAYLCPYEAQLEVELGTQLKRGQCSTAAFATQSFNGFERTFSKPRLTMKFPTWASTGNTLFAADGTSTVFKHVLMASGTTAGRSVACYLPKMFIVDPVPGHDDVDGVIGYSMTLEGTESTAETTNDLSKSCFRLAFG